MTATTARRLRRRALGVAATGVLLAGCSVGPEVTGATGPTDTSDAPDQIAVACLGDGITVSSPTVAASPQGVVVASTTTADTHLSYRFDEPSAGSIGGGLSGVTTPELIDAPPGTVTLVCGSSSTSEEHEVDVEVVDPSDYWREATTDDSGCGFEGQPSWSYHRQRRWPTPQRAVTALLVDLAAGQHGETARVRRQTSVPLEVGYVGGPAMRLVFSPTGAPEMTVRISEVGAGFSAAPDFLCGDPA